jgi:acylphosphatase
LTRLHLVVRGRVQGVGFRWFTLETAESLGLTGWVKNLKDGSVEAEAEGSEAALDEFVKKLRTGNPHATVNEITTKPAVIKQDKAFRII